MDEQRSTIGPSAGCVRIVSAPHADTFGYAMPPPGLLRLGGWLEREGWRVELRDFAHLLARGDLPAGDGLADAAAERALVGGAPWVLGLSVMGATLPIALAIAKRVRARAPNVRIVMGGPGTTGLDRLLLERFPAIDAVVRGEGEVAFCELLERWARGRDAAGVLGVTWRTATGAERESDRAPIADLARLAAPAWHLLPPLAEYKRVSGEDEGLVPIDSGRGCVYDCSFCTIGRFWGRRSRPLPAVRLADEIDAALRLAGARRAYLCHDLFGADRKHALELARELSARGGRPFEIRARIDHLDGELARALGAAGCYRVLLGIESADGALRNAHGKRMDVELDLRARLVELSRAGITPILSLILGLPGEGEAGLRATLDLALRASLAAGVHLSFHLVNPQPGCGLGETHGADSRPVDDLPPDMALGAGTSACERELIQAHPDMFSTFAVLTGEPGGIERLRMLRQLSDRLARRLERTPRTFAALAALRGVDTLDLYRQVEAAGCSFEAVARGERDVLVDGLLEWELGLLRTAARSGPGARGLGNSAGDAPTDSAAAAAAAAGPRARAEVLRLDVDAPHWAETLRDLPPGAPLPAVERRPTVLALAPGPRGVRTLRINAPVAALLELADGRPLAAIEAALPGAEAALMRLAQEGLVEPLPPRGPATPQRSPAGPSERG